jgi:hypothetical protein
MLLGAHGNWVFSQRLPFPRIGPTFPAEQLLFRFMVSYFLLYIAMRAVSCV